MSGISPNGCSDFIKNASKWIARKVGLGIKLEKLGTVLTGKWCALSMLVSVMPLMLLFTGDVTLVFPLVFYPYGTFCNGQHRVEYAACET